MPRNKEMEKLMEEKSCQICEGAEKMVRPFAKTNIGEDVNNGLETSNEKTERKTQKEGVGI